jgi:hypothetical protein
MFNITEHPYVFYAFHLRIGSPHFAVPLAMGFPTHNDYRHSE